ncbi:hypothetical protein [Comamonas odontotermitis]|nr:hypothetical protein [Comamonas odontotermitis]
MHERIVALRTKGYSIAEAAMLARCSASQLKRVWSIHQIAKNQNQ